MVFLGGGGGEAFKVELLGFKGVGWGGGFDLGDEVEEIGSVHTILPSSLDEVLFVDNSYLN